MFGFTPEMFGWLAAGGKLGAGIGGFLGHSQAAELAEFNARMLMLQSEVFRERGQLAVTRSAYDQFLVRRKGQQVMAAQTAAAAGGNVDPAYGTPLWQQGFSAAQVEVDAGLLLARGLSERADALTGAANLATRATGERFRAAAEETAAWSSLITAPLGAATAFLSAQRTPWLGLGAASGEGRAGYVSTGSGYGLG